MNLVKPSIVSAVLVIFVGCLGFSAGNANGITPAVMSPLLAAQGSNIFGGPGEFTVLPDVVTENNRAAFVNPPENGGASWKAISVGKGHSCAIRNDDTLLCWGDNTFGQANPPEGQFVWVAAGMLQSCGIRLDGQLLCWGSERARPKEPAEGTFKSVSVGNSHTCAIRHDGWVQCWGADTFQQTDAPEGQFEAVSAGGNHACALLGDGRLVCWGEQSFTAYPAPAGRFQAVVTGESHACAIREDDSVVCWGNDGYGQIKAPEGAFKTLTAGGFHTCGLRFDGVSVCWGRDDAGQSNVPVGEGFKVLSAGGMTSCGIRSDDSWQCWGGNEATDRSQGMRAQVLGSAQPQFAAVIPVLLQIAGFLGTSLVATGKAIDTKTNTWEGKAAVIRTICMVAGLVLAIVQTSMPQPPDPVAEALKRIEADIQELKAAVGRIEAQMAQIQAKLNTLACNVSLQPLVNAGLMIETAQESYLQRMTEAQIVLQAYAARAHDPTVAVPDPTPDMASFVGEYENKLRLALNAVHEALVPALSTKSSAFDDCMEKSLSQWKAQANIPFVDDRVYYQPIYEILGYALAYQGMALLMLQDSNLWHAEQKLRGGKVENKAEDLLGFCAVIRENGKAGGPQAAVWQQAQAYCDDTTNLTERTYKRMVQQVERAGAPYADDDTMLSLGARLIGQNVPWGKDSWLWVRDVDAYGDTRGLFKAGIPQPQINQEKEYTLYRNWEPAGQAWLDVKHVLLKQLAAKTAVDLPVLMKDRAGFKNITDRLMWASGKTFYVRWNNVADFHDRRQSSIFDPPPINVDDVTIRDMKCFVGSGIGPKYAVDKGVQGLVCGEAEVKQIAGRLGLAWGKNKMDKVNFEVGTRSWEDNRYQQYRNLLGAAYGYWYCWVPDSASYVNGRMVTHCDWRGFKSKTAYFPNEDKELYRWPVIDLEKSQCTGSMVNEGVKRNKTTPGGALTRCGDDLDRVINALVPRPDSLNKQAAGAALESQL
ncbi:RCC1 domain-containing protein [Methylococcus mesophilus]|uniref:RCC1 domain-containing protein n=1 Tax=Methylococcus mesophilus TaxID=2993564 RepID=UPI00224A5CBA|nr:hypothetical protein [Methylococcus mesophilus]UZR29737.1 hypothetical protein OOT43_03625 [Methylococcus mesophilus]